MKNLSYFSRSLDKTFNTLKTSVVSLSKTRSPEPYNEFGNVQFGSRTSKASMGRCFISSNAIRRRIAISGKMRFTEALSMQRNVACSAFPN